MGVSVFRGPLLHQTHQPTQPANQPANQPRGTTREVRIIEPDKPGPSTSSPTGAGGAAHASSTGKLSPHSPRMSRGGLPRRNEEVRSRWFCSIFFLFFFVFKGGWGWGKKNRWLCVKCVGRFRGFFPLLLWLLMNESVKIFSWRERFFYFDGASEKWVLHEFHHRSRSFQPLGQLELYFFWVSHPHSH